MAGGSNGYQAALVRRQLTPGLISSLPGTVGLPPFISFSTTYPELDSAVRRPMRRIANGGRTNAFSVTFLSEQAGLKRLCCREWAEGVFIPTYVCVAKAGLLNDQQKHRIASAIARLHGEATRAPTWFVQVVIALNASIVTSKGFSSNSVYSATKAAVRSFARTWTTDLKDRRIRVNAVSPGSIDPPGLGDLLASSDVGEQRKAMLSNSVPLGRFGTPDEVANAVVFLASDDASYITGTELFVDGGIAQV
jgi:NAD(P)-dependent dehydrogenase (short-subunit alcohol dehydrogenase family)